MPRDPIEIELKDGELAKFLILSDGLRARFEVMPQVGQKELEIYEGTESGLLNRVRMQPDPVHTAVQAETERCKAAVDQECASIHLTDRTRLSIVAAIDAPDESSEYRRGEGEMLEKCVTVLEGQRHYCAHVESLVEELRKHLSEPTHG